MADEAFVARRVAEVKRSNDCPGGQYPDSNWGGKTEFIDPLSDVLCTFDDANGRANAAKALGWIGDDRVLDPLREAIIDDPEPQVRNAAAWGLRSLGSPDAVSILQTVAAEDDDDDVRWQAGRALAVIDWAGKPNYARQLLRDGDDRAWEGFRREIGLEHVDGRQALRKQFEECLARGEGDLERVVDGLGAFEGTTDTLLEFLDCDDAEVREATVSGLRDQGDAAASEHLARVGREDPDPSVRGAAVEALGYLRNHESDEETDVLACLRPFLDDPAATVREAAVHQLRFADRPANVPTLVEALKDPDPGVRARAAWGLKVAGFPGPVPELLDAYADDDSAVRENVVRALQWIAGDVGQVDASDFDLFESETVPTLDASCRRPYEPKRARVILESALSDPDPDVAREAAHALSATNHPDAAAVLTSFLTEGGRETTQTYAANYLGWFEDCEEARDGLRRALDHGSPAVRAAAVDRSGRLPHREQIDAVLDALEDDAPSVREAAANRARSLDEERLTQTLREQLAIEADDSVAFALKRAMGEFSE